MTEKIRTFSKKLVSFLLVTSMAVSLLPVHAFAYIPGSEGEGRFKNMFMNSAENQRPIASYMYADNNNFFNTPTTINLSNPGGLEWMLLTFAVEKGQSVDLQLEPFPKKRTQKVKKKWNDSRGIRYRWLCSGAEKIILKTRGRNPTQSRVRAEGVVEYFQIGKDIALRRRSGWIVF